MIDKSGFRKDNLTPFFNQVAFSVPPDQKQFTPFVVHVDNNVKKCNTIDELLEYKDDVEVLQTWPGKSKSDVFYFTVKDVREHIKKGGK
jgi:hypothetical protein